MIVLTRRVTRDTKTGIWVVAIEGELSLSGHGLVRQTLQKCVTECPAAIVIDLHGLSGYDNLVASLMATVQRRMDEVGIRLLFTADAAAQDWLRAGPCRRSVDVYPTLEQATAAVLQPNGLRWLRLVLPPEPQSSTRARTLVGDACLTWGVRHVVHHARLLASELVANAVEHAGTRVELTATVRGDHLHIRVRDGNPVHPVRGRDEPDEAAAWTVRGVGLRLVERYATAWGVVDVEDGKVVWATVRVRPIQHGAIVRAASPLQISPGEPLPNRPAGPRRPTPRPPPTGSALI